MKIGTSVKIKVGAHPACKGRVAGVKETRSNGVFIPVNIAEPGQPRDVRRYREAYLTPLDANGKPFAKAAVKPEPKKAPAKPAVKAAAPAKKASVKK